MKLLLVDDEIITRKGLLESIDWKSLQIHQILEADDGVQALELAKKHSPEIVLTDIRMPRMDGVSLVNHIRELLPNTSIIFMSGYSDKEYLRAAIRLKAVSYVEKPINNQEVSAAVQEAVHTHDLLERNKYTKYLQYQEKTSQLTMALTRPTNSEQQTVPKLIEELDLPFDERTVFLTLLLKALPPFLSLEDPEFSSILNQLTVMVRTKPFDFIYALKYDSTLVFHLYAPRTPDPASVQDFVQYLGQQLTPLCSWFIAVGPYVQGTANVYESYNRAAILLQSSFFYDYNSILVEQETAGLNTDFLEQAAGEFGERVSRKDAEGAVQAAESLLKHLKKCQSLLPSIVKDVYFKLFIALEQAYRIQLISDEDSAEPIWDRILSCHTLPELHSMLLEELHRLDERSEEGQQESTPVSLMKDCIYKNYANDALSVKDISAYAGLSVAYACTLFKSETGKTLNQYLTEYRMEKAKQFLSDPRTRISDISARIGYLDGNYFSKSFKKITGLTPSEYREKLLS